uniref:eIF3a PCI domain-containing protein n=1 Tax=Euplotes harpa TaxID=151035 RepID=A0A7S3JIY1_9SPIT|mmetsp:Transcript_42768/g.50129  ORF Transcript_42768/g.50129 Transcript_42768/m.50129 type:complete len:900 (+) Transcript_42768:444-3143(+)
MLQAFQSEEQWENKDKIGPCIKFLVESYEIILDVLRQNSMLLAFYNSTAIHCMEFCVKNNRKNEFKRITDTLSKHLKHILSTKKAEVQKNIPHPVLISDNLSFEKILELRLKTLEFCLKIGNWSDGLKTVKDIKEIDKVRKASKYKGLNLINKAIFLELIAELFKEAKYYLFYSATLCSADRKYRTCKKKDEDIKRAMRLEENQNIVIQNPYTDKIPSQRTYADKIILSYLMIPLDKRVSNFKEIGFNILTEEAEAKSKNFLKFTDLIEQSPDLDRSTILKYIHDRNLISICSPEIKDLFRCFEINLYIIESVLIKPSELSKTSEQCLAWLTSHSEYSQFATEIRTNLIIRILQKLGKVFKVMKFDSFRRMFKFIDFFECEKIIIEGNKSYIVNNSTSYFSKALTSHSSDTPFRHREKLFNIKLDPRNQKIIFDSYQENELVMQQLQAFVADVKRIHALIEKNKESSREVSCKVFSKILENVPAEIDNIYLRLETDGEKREQMRKEMEETRRRDEADSKLTEAQRAQKYEQEKNELEKKILRENVLRDKFDYLKIKITEFVSFLDREGIKSVNGVPLKDVLTAQEDIEQVYYDLKDQVDLITNKKQDEANNYANKILNEADLTERAMRAYETPKLLEELKQRNSTEIEDLRKYLLDKHTNDVKMKHLLIQSSESKDIYLRGVMEQRKKELEENTKEYLVQTTKQIKELLIAKAMKKLRVEENKRIAEERQKAMRERDMTKRADDPTASSSDAGGMSRKGFGTERPQPSSESSFGDRRRNDDSGPKKYSGKPRRDDEGGAGFSRTAFGTGEKEPMPPRDLAKQSDRPPVRDGPPKFLSSKPQFSGSKGGDWRNKGDKPKEDKPKEEEKKTAAPKPAPKPAPKKGPKEKKDGASRFQSDNW